ncbi:MAG TPA: sulfatase-like hydrolase/transferase [Gemmataceae bacterium]|nr:sulfatase-like hydrolase/transferase [Gemmataceae bacterium]
MKVLVLAVRGLQTAYVGCYGNPWIATPALDALAAGGVVFDRHFADRADADGARLTWRDGRHHPPDSPHRESSADATADLIEVLKKRGVYTCLIVDDSRPAEVGLEHNGDEVHRAASFGAVLEAASAALHRLSGRGDWLLWVDLAALLPPWDTPEEFVAPYFQEEPADDEDVEGEEVELEPLTPLRNPPIGRVDAEDDELFLQLQGSYAGAVSWLDDGIGRLLQRLDVVNAGHEIMVVLTADSGLALGEHGYVGPGCPHTHAEATHLPLILCLPGADEAGRRVAALTQAADLAPTLADVFDVELPSAQGCTLLPLVYGEVEELHPYVSSGARAGDAVEWCLRTLQWAFMLPLPSGPPRLYVQPDDRWEATNVVQHHLELVEGLERTLSSFVEASRRPGPLEPPPLPQTESGDQERHGGSGD